MPVTSAGGPSEQQPLNSGSTTRTEQTGHSGGATFKVYMKIGTMEGDQRERIVGTTDKNARSTAKEIVNYLSYETATIDFLKEDPEKLNKIEKYLEKGENKIAKKAEKFVDNHMCTLPSSVKSMAKQVVTFLLEAKSAFKNADGIRGLLSTKSDTVYFQEAKQLVGAHQERASALKQSMESRNEKIKDSLKKEDTSLENLANTKLESLSPQIKDIMNKSGFHEDANEIRNILLSEDLTDFQKLEQYQTKFFEALSKYVKSEGEDPEALQKAIHSKNSDEMFAAMKKVISPEDMGNMNMAILYSDTSKLSHLSHVIDGFNRNFDNLVAPMKHSVAELDLAGHRESALQRLNTGMDLIRG